MVTMHENADYLLEAVKAGAAGYVLKDASGERLLNAVRRTLDGESPLNQELAMRLLVRLSRESSSEQGSGGLSSKTAEVAPEEGSREVQSEVGEPPAPHPEATQAGVYQAGTGGTGRSRGAEQMESLTPREVEVLRLLSQGQTNPQIAQNLMVSRGTVKIHVQHI